MPRRTRLQLPDVAYHVMARGNRKQPIFHDNLDRLRFLRIVERAVDFYTLRVLAYCLMGNHYHLILETPRANVSAAMQYINGRFAQASNRRYAQSGHLFGERFRALIIQREMYLKRAVRYVVRNPVRAGLVTTVEEWRWSSYAATAGFAPLPEWLKADWLPWAFGADTLDLARARLVAYVNAPVQRPSKMDPRAEVFGTARFKAQIAAQVQARLADRPLPRGHTLPLRPTLNTLFASTEDSLGSRDRIIHVSRAAHGYRLSEIARFLRLHPSTISRACQRGATG